MKFRRFLQKTDFETKFHSSLIGRFPGECHLRQFHQGNMWAAIGSGPSILGAKKTGGWPGHHRT